MTLPRSDPYADLGVPRDASSEQVREAYRRLAKRYHPDLHPDAATSERMRRINQAWHVLSSTTRRAQFDTTMARSRRRTQWAGSPPRVWSTAAAPAGTSWRIDSSASRRDIHSRHTSRYEPDQGADGGLSWSAGLIAGAVAFAGLVLVSAAFGFLPLPVFAIVLLLARAAISRPG
jgi:curved DNA-binding protein CbpA